MDPAIIASRPATLDSATESAGAGLLLVCLMHAEPAVVLIMGIDLTWYGPLISPACTFMFVDSVMLALPEYEGSSVIKFVHRVTPRQVVCRMVFCGLAKL